ncbi:conserved hypothetical protein [Aurantimonas manganoxydans SI85-9A1]|uniref:Uncharacterized protein n=2 Tax=Aurantimonas manganoxydans TaxID=651183 RepID=Q1YG01_AURMS|nr:conserved hypothetical protein [Aurantimonas manganoxydans SI85-9A1]
MRAATIRCPVAPDQPFGRENHGAECVGRWARERSMALQNRVTPLGEIVVDPARGDFMGNRGILHDGMRRLGVSRWKHKAWIVCTLAFKSRKREIMAPGRYTELFFLDEATALAAGHRPCWECRRAAALAYRSAFAEGNGLENAPSSHEIDDLLHASRIVTGTRHQRRAERVGGELPDGVFVIVEERAWVVLNNRLLRWTPAGYDAMREMPDGPVTVATPLPSAAAIAAGYRPALHASAAALAGG